MKATNNINADLKDEIRQLRDNESKLIIQAEDAELIVTTKVNETKTELQTIIDGKEEMITEMSDELKKKTEELESFKKNYNFKMQQIKIMELELDQKLNAAD